MKLLHVAASYLPAVRYGGTIVSVHGLCRALVERGHEVHVYTTSVNGATDSDVPHGEPVDVDGVKVWYFRSPTFRRIYWAPDLAAALAKHVASFDVVHTHAIFLWPLWAAARAARRAGVPYVVSPRGMLERDLVSRQSPLLKGLWIAAIERHNLEGAAALHITSQREADEAAVFGFTLPPMREIPNGVSLEAPSGTVSESIQSIVGSEPYVLFLGRISWKKGLDRLIAALPHVSARLVIAGNDDEQYTPVLEGIADRLGVRDRITFTGPVNGADKGALLRHARAMVLPSYSENFGNVVIEAMAEACPVVVSRDVGLADVVDSTGAGLTVEGSSTSVAFAVERLLQDPSLRAQMGQRGARAAREHYAWPVVAKQMEDLYASLMQVPRA
ncbi:MAG TPA: glycosyltransferase [Vicinamibacterales bacterium]|nr:glycosyltransferase [Vicinamibacterales bacterium]